MTAFLPKVGEAMVENTGQPRPSYRRWMQQVTEAVNAPATPPGPDPEPPTPPASFVINGSGSVTADGSIAGGEFVIGLDNDKDEPGNTKFYGTDSSGNRGFVALSEGLEAGSGIALTDSGYTMLPSVATPADLPLTGNAGEAVRVTDEAPGVYAWDGAAFTLDTTADGKAGVVLDATADLIGYDPTASGLAAIDVQAAVDELAVKVASGTVNPASPYANQRFWREDIHQLIYYDAVGLQWLTVQQFPLELPAGDGNPSITVSGQRTGRGAVRQDLQLYLSRWDCNTFVVGTNNGSNYWTVDLSWINATNAATSLASFNTSADTVANNVVHAPALGVVLPSTAKVLAVTGTKTGTPGALYAFGPLAYRLIVP